MGPPRRGVEGSSVGAQPRDDEVKATHVPQVTSSQARNRERLSDALSKGVRAGRPQIVSKRAYLRLRAETTSVEAKPARYRSIHPGPRTATPGFAPVTRPPSTTATPLTSTYRMPVESWCGRSYVARSAIVFGSK